MLLFLFVSLSVFLSLHDVPEKVFLVNKNGSKIPLAPVAKALNLLSNKTFFFHRNKDLYLLFCR